MRYLCCGPPFEYTQHGQTHTRLKNAFPSLMTACFCTFFGALATPFFDMAQYAPWTGKKEICPRLLSPSYLSAGDKRSKLSANQRLGDGCKSSVKKDFQPQRPGSLYVNADSSDAFLSVSNSFGVVKSCPGRLCDSLSQEAIFPRTAKSLAHLSFNMSQLDGGPVCEPPRASRLSTQNHPPQPSTPPNLLVILKPSNFFLFVSHLSKYSS